MEAFVNEAYHREELAVALDATNPSHVLPPAVPRSHRVLDVGCGAGQTLIAAYPDIVSYGIDPDLAALRLGRSLTRQIRFVQGTAEALPWRDGQFDLVVARVSLPYSDLTLALREIRRVLANGGSVWMTLHSFSIVWAQARRANWKGWIHFAYILINSAAFALGLSQFRLGRRCESFQTRGGIRRALERTGFEAIDMRLGRHFLVTARADSHSPRKEKS
jgi:ubiquinone/menaquinone biosynthesis C-methylase UbiE